MNLRLKEELQQYVNSGNKVKYLCFWAHKPGAPIDKGCFSQWFESSFTEGEHAFPTAEHYMMFKKALLFKDFSTAGKILEAKHPGKAKELGRNVVGFVDETWLQHRFDIVVNANMAKFSQNEELEAFLLSTGERVLVEASPVDKIWGIGLAQDHPDCQNPNKWRGLNLLGFALMEVRERLRAG